MEIIAYYLPQFHEIPENNKWWGDGFTEWVNVKKATPLFSGHNQPRVPLNNNYLDLSLKENIKWQATIAKQHGIYGFCLYHYWFNGKLLLQKPIELLRDNPDIDIHYCLCWANENWNNGWVSSDNQILISNDFENEDYWVPHIQYLLTFFADDRYIKIGNKPLIVIYYPSLIKKISKMLNCWEEEAKKAGFDGLVFLYQHYLFSLDSSSDLSPFFGGIEFEPGYSKRTLSNIDVHRENSRIQFKNFVRTKLHINPKRGIPRKDPDHPEFIDYDSIWKEILSQKLGNNVYPGAFIDWDNTPRKGNRGSLMTGFSIEKFKRYFSMLVDRAKYVYKKDKIFFFAWNEWGEGGYLEPDESNRYAALEAIRDVLVEKDEFPYSQK